MNSRNLDFKVIHFSTGHAGGAGLAARRLSWELNIDLNEVAVDLFTKNMVLAVNRLKAVKRLENYCSGHDVKFVKSGLQTTSRAVQ